MSCGVWKVLFLPVVLILLFACATPDDTPEEPVEVIEQTGVSSTPADAPADAGTDAGTGAGTEPEREPEPDPADGQPQLVITAPADLSVLATARFSLAATIQPAGTELRSVEFEVLTGPYVGTGYVVGEVGDLPEALRVAEVPISRGVASIVLPRGLADGESYSWRARGVSASGETTAWTSPVATTLELGIPVPDPVPGRATIDRTPPLVWENQSEFTAYLLRLSSFDGTLIGEQAVRGNTFEIPEPLPPGAYQWTISGLSADGFASAVSSPALLRVLDDAAPVPLWPVGGQTTLGDVVGLHWRPTQGAVGYETEYREEGSDWIAIGSTGAASAAVPTLLEPGQSYQWRTRAVDENGRSYSWSAASTFVVGSYALDFVTIIPAGESATFNRGYESGSRDERPVSQVTLTNPFEMSRTVLTNSQVARLVNYALENGFAEIDASGVYANGAERTPLLGLGEMDYGQQIGLEISGGVLAPRTGYENHPAVGITWLGATQLANLLSFAEGRSPAQDNNGGPLDLSADGYRLPTEAEWEYAARGSTDRLLPWGGALTGRIANYYRSFDPFEDVSEPFTGAGGPTTPVDFFNGASRAGFRTSSGESPFGVLDLVGNTWEWCWDRYDPEYYSSPETVDPVGPERSDLEVGEQSVVLAVTLDPDQRVVRGTAWNSRAPDVRLTNRGRYTELGRSYSIGVRLVRPPGQ